MFFMYFGSPARFFGYERSTGETIMEWQPSGFVLNPIENLWSIVKMKLYEGDKPYISKVDLWETIKTSMLETKLAEVKKSTKSWIIDYSL